MSYKQCMCETRNPCLCFLERPNSWCLSRTWCDMDAAFSFSLHGLYCPHDYCTLNCAVNWLPEKEKGSELPSSIQPHYLIAADCENSSEQVFIWILSTREGSGLNLHFWAIAQMQITKFLSLVLSAPQWSRQRHLVNIQDLGTAVWKQMLPTRLFSFSY